MNKHTIGLACLLVHTALTAQPLLEQMTLLNEQFDNNINRWLLQNKDADVLELKDGVYKWTCKSPNAMHITYPVARLSDDREYIITTRYIRQSQSPDHRFMLVWGERDAANWWAFSVRARDFQVLNRTQNITETLIQYKKSSFIRDTNELRIHALTFKADFYINDELVYSHPKPIRLAGTGVGFAQANNGSVSIDWLRVEQFDEAINLLPDADQFGTPERLSERVNSDISDIAPIISHDGKTLYFIRMGRGSVPLVGGQGKGDIFVSELDAAGNWGEAVALDTPINDNFTNSVCAALPDGNTLLLQNLYSRAGSSFDGISITRRAAKGWEYPTNQKILQFENKSRYVDYTLSPDGATLIMSIQMQNTLGDRDLYVSFRKNDSTWSAPKHMGKVINTTKSDFAPFIAADNKTLYFSSDGHAGFGAVDVFLARRLDDTWTNWTRPYNLGNRVNTPSFDAYYSVSRQGDYAYYVSADATRREDIFRIKLAPSAKPEPTVLIRGTVFDAKTKKPIGAKIAYQSLQDSTTKGIAAANPQNGHYQLIVPYGSVYGFLAEADQYLAVSENLDVTKRINSKEMQIIERNLYLVPMQTGEIVRLNNLFFESAKWDLLPNSQPELERLVKMLVENPSLTIQLEGHTDNVGTDANNKTLSEKRVQVVKQFLVTRGIDAKRIQCVGYGKTKPVAPNTTDEGRAQNRRVEFRILKI